MSANIAVIYNGDLRQIAAAFGEAAEHVSARVRLLRVSGGKDDDISGTY